MKLPDFRTIDYLISLVIILLIALFFGFHKYSTFEISYFTIMNLLVIGTITNNLIKIDKFQPGREKYIQATRIKNIISAFMSIPAIYSIILVTFASSFHQNLLLLIPEKVFTDILIDDLGFVRAILFLWFKLLINAQAIIIALVALEVVRFQNETRSEELKKYEVYFNKYHSKSISSNNKFKEKFYYFCAYKIIWAQWISISVLYLIIIFTFKSSIFN